MALNKGIWDPEPRGTNSKGTNLKSLTIGSPFQGSGQTKAPATILHKSLHNLNCPRHFAFVAEPFDSPLQSDSGNQSPSS